HEGALVADLRRVGLPLRAQRAAEIVKCLDSVRAKRQDPSKTADGLVQPAEILEGRAEIVVQFDGVRPQAQPPLEIGDRPRGLPEILARIPEIVECVDRIRRERERLLKAHYCLGELTPFSENIAEIVVKCRITTVSRDRIADVFDRAVRTAPVMLDE